MATLKEEIAKLTVPSLVAGIIETIITRGAKEYFLALPFHSFEGSTYDFTPESQLPDESSLNDPYMDTSGTIVGGRGYVDRLAVDVGLLVRNADTPEVAIYGKSNINDQHAKDVQLHTKKLAEDFMSNGVHGRNQGLALRGWDWWLDYYAGFYTTSGAGLQTDSEFKGGYTEQKIFGTDTGDPFGTPQLLSLNLLNQLTVSYKVNPFQVLYCPRHVWIGIKSLLDAAPGNTAREFMSETFGRPALMYNGVEIVMFDKVGEEKTAKGTISVATDGTLTVTDNKFVGFSDLDIGRTVTVRDAGGASLYSGTIDGVTSKNTAVVAAAPLAAVSGTSMELARTNAIYGVYYDTLDGVAAIYHSQRGLPGSPVEGTMRAGVHYGPIAGFAAKPIGLLQDSSVYRTRIDWFGNFVSHTPYALARLSHFTLPS